MKARLGLTIVVFGLVLLGLGCGKDSSSGTYSGDESRSRGETTITQKAYASLVITPNRETQPLGRVEIVPKEVVVLAGQPFVFTARAFDTRGAALANVSRDGKR